MFLEFVELDGLAVELQEAAKRFAATMDAVDYRDEEAWSEAWEPAYDRLYDEVGDRDDWDQLELALGF